MRQGAVDTADSGEAGESRDHDIRGNGQIKSTQVFFEDLRQGMLIKGAVEITREKISQFAIVTDDINVATKALHTGCCWRRLQWEWSAIISAVHGTMLLFTSTSKLISRA